MAEQNSPTESLKEVQRLLYTLCDRLKSNIGEMTRPLVIEFAGTPKAGKTMCVNSLAKFLRRNQIDTYIVTERASVCPLRDKKNPSFNFWTGSTSVAQLLEAVDLHKEERRAPVIILDRGLFDSLVWISYHEAEGSLDSEEVYAIEEFFLMDRLVRQIDLVVSLTVDPGESLLRESQAQIIPTEGSIMNPGVLTKYNDSLKTVRARCGSRFNKVVDVDTTDTNPEEGVLKIARHVLLALDDLLDERVAAVSRQVVEELFDGSRIATGKTNVERMLPVFIDNIKWLRRSEAEERYDLVQLIPVAIPLRDGEILVVTNRGVRHGRLTDRHAVWVGGHCRKTDHKKTKATIFRQTLKREIEEELKLSMSLQELSRLPRALIWETSQARSAQHLGIFYAWDLPKRVPRERLHEREIPEREDKSLFTRFVPIGRELLQFQPWESWSVAFLRGAFDLKGLEFEIDERQLSLFERWRR